MESKTKSYIKINERDNVAVALTDLKKGSVCADVTLLGDIETGHKFALCDIPKGGQVIKYGFSIGTAEADIAQGGHVHVFNLRTNLDENLDYSYNKDAIKTAKAGANRRIRVYERENGEVGIRNELWVVPTVGCVNAQARLIAERFKKENECGGVDDVVAFSHPYGCSQTGEDHERTVKVLQQLVLHPNAGGVLVLGLGCENNQVSRFKATLGEYDASRIKFLVAQEVEDEIDEGVGLLKELYAAAKRDKRVERDIGCLKVGLKCGGSDGLSGITANPLLGLFSDYLVALGGSTVLTEVPEMFGAEELLMRRAKNRTVFEKTVNLISGFKDYYKQNGQKIYENPSPGNKAGGITTLEDKSLGCTQKGGVAAVSDVLFDGDRVKSKGLSLLNGPGNDMIAVTNLGAAGCHLVLFTTGRGTPFGGFIPTVKVSTSDRLFAAKPGWIDFNAGSVLGAEGFEKTLEAFTDKIVEIASGQKTKNEQSGSREIAIFKTGVTL